MAGLTFVAADFEISPQSLLTGAQRMQRAGEDLLGAVQRLQGQVLGGGSPWGDDELGSIFAETYTTCTQSGLQALSHLAAVLDSVGTALAREADNTRSMDEKAASGMDGIC